MIRVLILLLVIGLVLAASYFGSYFINQTGKIIAKTNVEIFNKFNYYISSFIIKNYTKIVITFIEPINVSCIKYVKINNRTVDYSYEKIRENMIEIDVHKKLRGAYPIEIGFCEGTIKDTIIVQ